MIAKLRPPVVFLDFDDVLALNNPVGGYDVLEALRLIANDGRPVSDFSDVWSAVFDRGCVERLRRLDCEFQPRYVLSTSWCAFMNETAIRILFEQTGLAFVQNGLHLNSQTPRDYGRAPSRRDEISNWILENPLDATSWVVLDDEQSGGGLRDWPEKAQRQFIVLCKVGVGLDRAKFESARRALTKRVSKRTGPHYARHRSRS